MKIQFSRKYDLIIALMIAGVLIILANSFYFENYLKPIKEKEYFKPNLYRVNKGIITDKYIDIDNHSYKTIEFIMNDSLDYYYILDGSPELFNYIQINDSILKTNFGNKIIIKRDKMDSTFTIK